MDLIYLFALYWPIDPLEWNRNPVGYCVFLMEDVERCMNQVKEDRKIKVRIDF